LQPGGSRTGGAVLSGFGHLLGLCQAAPQGLPWRELAGRLGEKKVCKILGPSQDGDPPKSYFNYFIYDIVSTIFVYACLYRINLDKRSLFIKDFHRFLDFDLFEALV
jgi:hypothetical protein